MYVNSPLLLHARTREELLDRQGYLDNDRAGPIGKEIEDHAQNDHELASQRSPEPVPSVRWRRRVPCGPEPALLPDCRGKASHEPAAGRSLCFLPQESPKSRLRRRVVPAVRKADQNHHRSFRAIRSPRSTDHGGIGTHAVGSPAIPPRECSHAHHERPTKSPTLPRGISF